MLYNLGDIWLSGGLAKATKQEVIHPSVNLGSSGVPVLGLVLLEFSERQMCMIRSHNFNAVPELLVQRKVLLWQAIIRIQGYKPGP